MMDMADKATIKHSSVTSDPMDVDTTQPSVPPSLNDSIPDQQPQTWDSSAGPKHEVDSPSEELRTQSDPAPSALANSTAIDYQAQIPEALSASSDICAYDEPSSFITSEEEGSPDEDASELEFNDEDVAESLGTIIPHDNVDSSQPANVSSHDQPGLAVSLDSQKTTQSQDPITSTYSKEGSNATKIQMDLQNEDMDPLPRNESRSYVPTTPNDIAPVGFCTSSSTNHNLKHNSNDQAAQVDAKDVSVSPPENSSSGTSSLGDQIKQEPDIDKPNLSNIDEYTLGVEKGECMGQFKRSENEVIDLTGDDDDDVATYIHGDSHNENLPETTEPMNLHDSIHPTRQDNQTSAIFEAPPSHKDTPGDTETVFDHQTLESILQFELKQGTSSSSRKRDLGTQRANGSDSLFIPEEPEGDKFDFSHPETHGKRKKTKQRGRSQPASKKIKKSHHSEKIDGGVDLNKRAKNPTDYFAKRHITHPRKDWGREYKEEEFERIRTEAREPSKNVGVRVQARNATYDRAFSLHTTSAAQVSSASIPDTFGSGKTTQKDFLEHFRNHGDNDIKRLAPSARKIVEVSRVFGFGQIKRVPIKRVVTINHEQMIKKEFRWKLKKMPTPLTTAQMLGSAFALERECYSEAPHGTLIADEMGTGKTIQIMVPCVVKPPTKAQRKAKITTTLFVVPSHLASQTMRELEKHAGEIGECIIRFKKDMKENTLRAQSVVVATYDDVRESHPNPNKATERGWACDDLDELYERHEEWAQKHPELRGVLHRIEWLRIILDESHYIKNYRCRTSRAAVALEGVYRHAMSGTPVMNSYMEFYPQFRFLREPITMEMDPVVFRKTFCDDKDPSTTRLLGCLFSDFLIRRKLEDRILGSPIVELPPYHKSVRTVKLCYGERLLQEAFSLRLEEIAVEKFPDGHVLAKLQSQYAQLTRNRMLLANPVLIVPQMMAIFSVQQIMDLRKKIQKHRHPYDKQEFHNVLHELFDMMISMKETGQDKAFAFDDVDICPRCQTPQEYLYTIKCKHYFCEECIESLKNEPDDDIEDGMVRCPENSCSRPFNPDAKRPYKKGPDSSKQKPGRRAKPKYRLKAKDATGFRPVIPAQQEWVQHWLDLFDEDKVKLLRSGKLINTHEQVREWMGEQHGTKTIVFSQFVTTQIFLGSMFEEEDIKFVYLSGGMTTRQREAAIEKFRTDPSVQVMIAGLKCGGVGLNLSFANRCIIIDLWWNDCIDNQAFSRIFRFGQIFETHLVRILVRRSVDSRIWNLQQKKRKAINQVMQENHLTDAEIAAVLREPTYFTWENLIANFDYNENADENIAAEENPDGVEEVNDNDWSDDDFKDEDDDISGSEGSASDTDDTYNE